MGISALASACATTGPRSAAQRDADLLAANRIYLALNADPTYYYKHVDVRVDNGTADLSGYVWGSEAIYRARQIAGSVPGVTTVVTSDLELERAGRGNGRSR